MKHYLIIIALHIILFSCSTNKQVRVDFYSFEDDVWIKSIKKILQECSLDIKINRGKFLLLEELLETFQEGVDDLKEDIIKIKFNHLHHLYLLYVLVAIFYFF